MIKKDVPPGWYYEDGDPSVGIFGGEFVHEDCTVMAGPGSDEIVGVTQSKGFLTCCDCGQKVAYEDPSLLGGSEPEPEVVSSPFVKKPAVREKLEVTAGRKAYLVFLLLVLGYFACWSAYDARMSHWELLTVDSISSLFMVYMVYVKWPKQDKTKGDDNDKSQELRDTWKDKSDR